MAGKASGCKKNANRIRSRPFCSGDPAQGGMQLEEKTKREGCHTLLLYFSIGVDKTSGTHGYAGHCFRISVFC